MKQSRPATLQFMSQTISKIVPQSGRQQISAQLEPGLLPVFRTVIGLQQVLFLIALAHSIYEGHSGERSLLPLVNVIALSVTFVYLSWSRLQRWLGRAYLPTALIFVTMYALVEHWLLLSTMDQLRGPSNLAPVLNGSGWLLLVRVLLPVVLTAWQYNFRTVMIFIAGATILDLAPTIWFTSWYAGPTMGALIGLGLSRALIYALVGIIVTRIMAGQRAQRFALTEANAQLAQHAATLEQLTTSRERNRLARELHDTLAHSLSAVTVQLEAVDSAWEANPAKARELLHKAQAQTRSGLTETRRALQSLRATPLDDLGLALAVRTLAESTAKRGGLALQMSIDGEPGNLTSDQEQQLYRITQEALANVLRHANAKTLHVDLKSAEGRTSITVADDGDGFDATGTQDKTKRGDYYGLRGMAERAETIGARLSIVSTPGQGTTVILAV